MEIKKYLSKKDIVKKASGLLATAILVSGLVGCNKNNDRVVDDVPPQAIDTDITPLLPEQWAEDCFEHDYQKQVKFQKVPSTNDAYCWMSDMITYNQCKNCGKIEGKIVNNAYFDKDGHLVANPNKDMVLVDEYYNHEIIGQKHEPSSILADFRLWHKDKCKNCGKDIVKDIVPADENTNLGRPQWEWELSK